MRSWHKSSDDADVSQWLDVQDEVRKAQTEVMWLIVLVIMKLQVVYLAASIE